MAELLVRHEVICPSCWESGTVVLDLSEPDQSLIEDCQVCCHPMLITFHAEDGELREVTVESS